MRKLTATICLTLVSLFGGTGVIWSAAANTGPSFDCDRASTPTEKAICSSETLSRLDWALATVYKKKKVKLAAGSENLAALRDKQRQWNKKRSSTCGDNVQCLSRIYQERIEFFAASTQFYTIKSGKFFTDEGEVPLGCFSELMIQLNGDDIVAAVYLDRTVLRGCITSNKHVLDENENYRLSIEKEKENDVFWIRICESNSGSMRQSCDKLIIQFVKRRYLTPKGNKDVVSIEKLGEWK